MKIKMRLQKVVIDLDMIREDCTTPQRAELEDIIRSLKKFVESVKK